MEVNRNIKSPESARGFWGFLESLWALGAVSIHRSGLETAFSEPREDPVFREADICLDPHVRDESSLHAELTLARSRASSSEGRKIQRLPSRQPGMSPTRAM